MESKQLTRKLNSVFWWALASIPLFVILFSFIYIGKLYGSETMIQNVLTNEDVYVISQIEEILDDNIFVNFMSACNLPFIESGLTNLFSAIGVNIRFVYVTFLITGLSWFVSIQCYHFILDVLLFVIRWAHDLLERGGKRC